MKKHFLQLQAYCTKNKAHEEIQKYVRQWHNALVDDESLKNVLNAIEEEISRINAKYARCKDISLSTNSYTENTIQYSVFENFYLVAHEIRREVLSPEPEPTALSVMDRMTKDDNQGIKMSKTITDVKDVAQGSIISFGVERNIGKDALSKIYGMPGEYMIVCMAVNKKELENTREKMKGVIK